MYFICISYVYGIKKEKHPLLYYVPFNINYMYFICISYVYGIKKEKQPSRIVSLLLDMSIKCEHAHRLELRESFTFWVAVAT